MKISLKWLNDYVDVSDYFQTPEKLADLLTHKGLEVESIENKAKIFQNVVVGHILEKGQHPNADRLTLCQVTTGGGKVHQIVCGAKNHNAGDRVVVALPGAILPGNFEIKLSKIRNVESQGMLCSESELGLKDEAEGILILPTEAVIGTPFADYMGLDDVVFELKVTPNRADCLSHYGLAREISCLLNKDLKMDFVKYGKDFFIKGEPSRGKTKSKISLEVLNPEMCPRYTGRYIENVKVGGSPQWLKQRLESIGMKSINNVVDITNYVMMELGQPLHAFDADLISGGGLIVSKAKEGEKFKTLDQTELTLKGSELMIRDKEKPVALAGVVGGMNSGIQDSTKNVFVESAYFTAESTRKSSRLHGVNTESGYRFSRGVDSNMTLNAMNRCCELIADLAGGTLYTEPWDTNASPKRVLEIELKVADISERLGFDPKPHDVESWMKRLGCEVQKKSEGVFKISPPSFRGDIFIKEDLIEEFARLYGYEHIPEKLPQSGYMPAAHEQKYTLGLKLNRLLRSEGFTESFNYAFVDGKKMSEFLGSSEDLKTVGFHLKTEKVFIKNPLSEEMNVMRQQISFGLLKNCLHNLRHGIQFGQLFEMGFVFGKEADSYQEIWSLGLVRWGLPFGLWNKEEKPEKTFFESKAHVENILKSLSIKSWQWEAQSILPFLHPGQSAQLKVEGKVLGYLGILHPQILEEEKIRVPVVLAEINLDVLMAGQPRVNRTKSVSKNPSVERDLAFVVPENLEAGKLLAEIQKAAGSVLKSISVFDVFKGGTLKEGEKSIAYRMIYQDAEKTLTDLDLSAIDKRILDAVSQKFSVTVR